MTKLEREEFKDYIDTRSKVCPPIEICPFNNSINRNDDNKSHISSRISQTGTKKYPQKRCVVCRRHGTPRDTRHCCKACNVALCMGRCFDEYHSM